MKTGFKIAAFWSVFCMVFLLVSCSGPYWNDWELPCEQDRIGTICFENYSDFTVKVKLEGEKYKLFPYETICFDLPEGKYNYKVTGGPDRINSKFWIEPCVEQWIVVSWP